MWQVHAVPRGHGQVGAPDESTTLGPARAERPRAGDGGRIDLRARPGRAESVEERTTLLRAGAGAAMSGIDGAVTSAPLADASRPDRSANPLGPQGEETSITRLERRLGWSRTGEYEAGSVSFTLDGVAVEARAGETILQAAERNGVP